MATLPPTEQATQYTQLGHDYLAQGLLPEAEQEFQAAIAADMSSAPAHAGLAQVREHSGSPEQARIEADTSIRLKPNAEAYLIMARIDLQTGHLADSADAVSKAQKLEPNNASVTGMKQALQQRGQTIP